MHCELMQGENEKGLSPNIPLIVYCHKWQQNCFDKYISNTRRANENLHPLLDAEGNNSDKEWGKDRNT